jgi:outer membrane protein OmpA-like peptidoglycan-associated protein
MLLVLAIAAPLQVLPVQAVQAAESVNVSANAVATGRAKQYRKDATIASAITVGAVAGGPIGAMLGAAGGVWMAGKVEQAAQLEHVQSDLAARKAELHSLRTQLAAAEHALQRESERYAQMALDQLELEMLFRTGDSALSAAGLQRLTLLAEYLLLNEDMEVRIEGFADPRGDSDYNLQLSQARAESVAAALREQSVPAERIIVQGRGEYPLAESVAGDGAMAPTLDDYALQRVARIALYRTGSDRAFLSTAQRDGD